MCSLASVPESLTFRLKCVLNYGLFVLSLDYLYHSRCTLLLTSVTDAAKHCIIVLRDCIQMFSTAMNDSMLLYVKVVLTYTEMWTFFALPNSKGVMSSKFVPCYHSNLEERHMAKFCGDTSTTAKVIGAHLLNFKPILDPFEKIARGTPNHSLVCVKIWGCSTPLLSLIHI